jgi:hypothetical protein
MTQGIGQGRVVTISQIIDEVKDLAINDYEIAKEKYCKFLQPELTPPTFEQVLAQRDIYDQFRKTYFSFKKCYQEMGFSVI